MSLPTRERGLKLPMGELLIEALESLPTRERGLKHVIRRIGEHHVGSLPTRERGLKLAFRKSVHKDHEVAPYTGAWIETLPCQWTPNRSGRRSLHGSVD